MKMSYSQINLFLENFQLKMLFERRKEDITYKYIDKLYEITFVQACEFIVETFVLFMFVLS